MNHVQPIIDVNEAIQSLSPEGRANLQNRAPDDPSPKRSGLPQVRVLRCALWSILFGANLAAPVWLANSTNSSDDMLTGLFIATFVLWIIGAWIFWKGMSFCRPLLDGMTILAVTQICPLIQAFAFLSAGAFWASLNSSFGHPSIANAFATFLLAGLILLGLAWLAGAVIRAGTGFINKDD